MGYADNTGVIIYQKPDQPFIIHRAHHVWFDEYYSCLSIEYNHTPGYLLLRQDTESLIHNSDLLNLIPCGISITSTLFRDTKILTYEIELPIYLNKVCFNLLDDEYFTITYITDTIPNSPAGHQLPSQAKKMYGSYISMGKRLSQLKVHLMNSISIKLHMENPRSILFYAEGRATI